MTSAYTVMPIVSRKISSVRAVTDCKIATIISCKPWTHGEEPFRLPSQLQALHDRNSRDRQRENARPATDATKGAWHTARRQGRPQVHWTRRVGSRSSAYYALVFATECRLRRTSNRFPSLTIRSKRISLRIRRRRKAAELLLLPPVDLEKRGERLSSR